MAAAGVGEWPWSGDAAAPGVSVVICAHTMDRWALLQAAVGSVLDQSHPPEEVVVVIDHNPELLEHALRRWRQASSSPPVRVVPNRRARGLSGARNTGLAETGTGVVAFLDDDAEADRSWIEKLVAAYADPAVAACGGAAIPVATGPMPRWWPQEFNWVVGCSYRGLPESRASVRNVIGANMSMRRAAALEAGGFCEQVGRVGYLPTGCEETDLCIRIAQRWPGCQIVYDPAAVVRHTVPGNRLSWRYFSSRCFSEGVSKAKIAARVGPSSALACERAYATRVLPRAVRAALGAACRGEPAAALRALAITAGLAITTAGYAHGRRAP